ncbi:stage III sporulation protein AD [Gottschalkia acidurici 9a]|uniref:Stage III sporulation protein AD n=1 Tax=Gottschalkia acidurici (strain ATCC 7906 / DSM 604 / BCRC 14475 / CIP 104303 / KCTC 5404 / NCIMB 10678 / 9a) TaxID=1128398 RepID=K0B0G5_GOTA9|nr:stage III sporulation protein AD [Gottschalkia acidurici]AFS78385.1 stage III sporulation protein AD [Gottschalkia acidurici 9a]
MDIVKIVGIGIIATTLSVILKQQKSEFAVQISIVTGLIIFSFILSQLEYVIDTLDSLAKRVELDSLYFSTVLKVVGISYIGEFGAQISRDAGEGAIASKIELGAKVIIMTMSVPILMSLLDLIIKIIP